MKLTVTHEAAQWYIKEMDLEAGDSIKFFGKVYGENGFSFALTKMEPSRPLIETVVDDIRFYVEKSDAWFFNDRDLTITLGEERNEPVYKFEEK